MTSEAPIDVQIHDNHTCVNKSTVHVCTNFHSSNPNSEEQQPIAISDDNSIELSVSMSPGEGTDIYTRQQGRFCHNRTENSQGDVSKMKIVPSHLSPDLDTVNSDLNSPSKIINESMVNLRSSTRKTKSPRTTETRTRSLSRRNATLSSPKENATFSLEPIPTYSPAPFSHEPSARTINEACDYSIRITADIARSGKAPRCVRVYADGAYDMFHSGHARQLMQAKCAFPNTYLLVGVSNDADLHRLKGRTVMNEKERYEAVRHCRYVDEVVPDAPWSITDDFLQKHKIDFVAHDDIPYASADCEDLYKPLKDAGMFIATQRTEGISTTDVIARIVRDYDIYLRRNIRRGLSRQDLNISFMKEKQLKLQNNLETMMKRGSTLFQNFDSKRRELVDQLEDISHEVLRSFIRIFGSDGRLRNWWSGRKRSLTYHQPDSSDMVGSGGSDCEPEYESPSLRKRFRASSDYSPDSRCSVSDSELQTSSRFVFKPRAMTDESSSENEDSALNNLRFDTTG